MKLSRENRCLGYLRSPKLPPGQAGTVSVRLEMSLDENGLLHASAHHPNSPPTNFQVNYRTRMASQNEAERMRRDSQALKKETCTEMKILEERNKLTRAIQVAKYHAKKVGLRQCMIFLI